MLECRGKILRRWQKKTWFQNDYPSSSYCRTEQEPNQCYAVRGHAYRVQHIICGQSRLNKENSCESPKDEKKLLQKIKEVGVRLEASEGLRLFMTCFDMTIGRRAGRRIPRQLLSQKMVLLRLPLKSSRLRSRERIVGCVG